MPIAQVHDAQDFDPILTGEASRITKVTPDTIRAWARSGRLPARKLAGGVRLFDRRDVQRLAEEREFR